MEELKPCPFCGLPGKKIYRRTNYISVENTKYLVAIGCTDSVKCFMPRVLVSDDIDADIKIWNTRAKE